MSNDYCISKCHVNARAALASLLRRLAQLKWNEIQSSSRQSVGHETIARDSLPASVARCIPDDKRALAFRASQDYRVIGYRREAVLHVVALDEDLSTYSHG